MHGARLSIVSLLLALAVISPSRPLSAADADQDYQKINQGDWAVALVRGLNLDRAHQLNSIDDFTALLAGVGIDPQEGWHSNYSLSFEDYVETISEALLYLNAHKGSEIYPDFIDFLSFLENKAGLRMITLVNGLEDNRELDNLRSGIADYLRYSATGGGGQKAKAGPENKTRELHFLDALFIRESRHLDNYWRIFNKPASPILPGKFH